MQTALRAEHAELAADMATLSQKALALADEIELLFVTNVRDGPMEDLGPDGVLNAGQHYSRRQAEEIIRSLQNLGLLVRPFFNERDFIAAALESDGTAGGRRRIVYTTAEGGTGSGRRALIPALCNLLDLPVFNSGAHACSIARHKFHAHAVLRRVGVRVPDTWQFTDGGWTGGSMPPMASRVIIKPMWESMCIGIGDDSVQIVDEHFESFVRAKSDQFKQSVLVQEFVTGEEVGVPLARLGRTHALPPMLFRQANGEPYGARPKTFRDIAVDRNVSFAPFHPSDALNASLRDNAILAFDALDMAGIGRIDFRIDLDGRAWVFDTNESPPPVKGTAYAAAMEQLGFSVPEMLSVWLGICLLDFGLISGI